MPNAAAQPRGDERPQRGTEFGRRLQLLVKPDRGQVRLSRQSMTESPAAITNAIALAQTGTSTPLTETGQARMKRSSCSRAMSANTTAAIVVNGFMSLRSYVHLMIRRQPPYWRKA